MFCLYQRPLSEEIVNSSSGSWHKISNSCASVVVVDTVDTALRRYEIRHLFETNFILLSSISKWFEEDKEQFRARGSNGSLSVETDGYNWDLEPCSFVHFG